MYNLDWAHGVNYGTVRKKEEFEFSRYSFETADINLHFQLFDLYEQECARTLDDGLPLAAFDWALKCSHTFNILDTRGAIEFIDLYTAQGCPVDRGELLRRFHAQEAGRPVVSGAAAFAAMWRAIPGLRPFGLIARFPPILWVLEAGYRVFLLLRPRLQRFARRALDS